MAKQRRPQTRSQKAPSSPSRQPQPPNAGTVGSAAAPAASVPLPTASHTERRSTYVDAVALYEQGLERLQRHDYSGAADRLESVLRLYPEEKELHERVKLYLNVCRKQASANPTAPQTIEERLYASTLALNGGRYDEAISHLRLVRDEDPDNDHALYMLAVAHAQRGELAEAVAHVERAIAMNPENRALARTDPDLDPLRADDAFTAALEAPPLARPERRRPLRPRSAR
jgi:outer membrane protein assembly factor BamD (BamD/ComL family)